MPKRTSIHRVERVYDNDRRTLAFKIPGTNRGNLVRFLSATTVPEFEGDVAYFEMERIPAKPWPVWRIIRQVEAPKP